MLRFARFFLSDPSLTRTNRLGFLAKIATIFAFGVLLFAVVPWPGAVRAPTIVQYSPMAVVRAGSPGFVRQIEVHSGEFVEEGELLVVCPH